MTDEYDIEKQPIPARETEGQDTITSMNNQAFIKQIRRLKSVMDSKSSLNSAFSTGTPPGTPSINGFRRSDSINSRTTSDSKSKLKVPKSLMDLFKSRQMSVDDSLTGLVIENQASNFNKDGSLSITSNINSHNAICDNNRLASTEFLNKLKSTQKLMNEANIQESQRLISNDSHTAAKKSRNQTDEVFDALSTIIYQSNNTLQDNQNFVNALKEIVKQNEASEQRKKDNIAWICTIITFTFLFFILLMVCFFTFNIYRISNTLIDRLDKSVALGNATIGD